MAAGEIITSLGYSEPSSGSDVFAAKTKAVRDGNDWIIRLESADGRWRLRGRLQRGERAVLLTPALPTP